MSWLSSHWLPLLAGAIVLVGVAMGWRDLVRFRFRRVRAIAGVCFTEAIRRRILWVTPVAILGVIAVSSLTHPDDELDAIRQTTRYCLFASGLIVIITTVLLACTNLPKEIESRVIFTIVTKPTTRLEIVLGKAMGLAGVSATMLLIMGIFTAGYLHLRAWSLQRNIAAALATHSADPIRESALRYYADVGLLNTKALAWPETLQIYSRVPSAEGTRWMAGEETMYYTQPFTFDAEDKAALETVLKSPPQFAFLVSELKLFMTPVRKPVEEPDASAPLLLQFQPLTLPAVKPTTVPTTMPTPKIAVRMGAEENMHLGGAEVEDKSYVGRLQHPGAAETAGTFLAPLPPHTVSEMLQTPTFNVRVLGSTGSVEYGVDTGSSYIGVFQPMSFYAPNAPAKIDPAPEAGEYRLYQPTRNDEQFLSAPLTLPKGAPLGFESVGPNRIVAVAGDQRIELSDGSYLWFRLSRRIDPTDPQKPGAVAVPLLTAHRGRSGAQIKGGTLANHFSPMGVCAFRNADLGKSDSDKVTVQVRVFVERAGELDMAGNVLSQAVVQIHNHKTGEISEPIIFEPESSQSVFVDAPAKYFAGGNFDVIVRGLTPGQFLGISGPSSNAPSVAVVIANTSFAGNLFKSLTILWLLSILVVVVSLFCSTFLSWPIAVVLTLLLLLGHWGVDQLGDAMAPGWTRSSAADIFGFRGAAENSAFTTTMEGLSRILRTVGSILPDIAKFPVMDDIDRGVSIPPARMFSAAAEVVWYGLPAVIMTYLILRNKEVAP